MTDKRPMDPELRSQIRQMPLPLPDPAYRERNRKLFTGKIPYGYDAGQTFEPASRGPVWLGLGVAAAAALLLVFMFNTSAPTWEVLAAETSGIVAINGTELDVRMLPGDIASDTMIETGDNGTLTVRIDRALNLVLAKNSGVNLGYERTLLGKPTLTAVVHRGTALGTTGPNFPASGLRIETDHARVLITGTTFSVLSNADTTCVCVLSGTVQVECKQTGNIQTVPSEHQLFVSREGAGTQLLPMTASQKMRLEAIRRRTP